MFNSVFAKIGACVRDVPCIGKMYMKSLYHSLSHGYDIASTFIMVHENTFDTLREAFD